MTEEQALKELNLKSFGEFSDMEEQFDPGGPSWDDDYCLCGELIVNCKDAYSHMSKGY